MNIKNTTPIGLDFSKLVSRQPEDKSYKKEPDFKTASEILAQAQKNVSTAEGIPETQSDSAKDIKEFEGGKLCKAGNINVLELEGSYYQMGRQYGELFKKELSGFYKDAVEEGFKRVVADRLIKERGVPPEKASQAAYQFLKGAAYSFYNTYPDKFKKMLDGMAETSGIEKEKLVILDQIIGCGFFAFGKPAECSAVAAWGDYSKGGTLVLGRNFDYYPFYEKFAKYLSVIRLKPNDNSNPVALIGYPGQIHSYTYINEKMFLALNAGNIFDEKNVKLGLENPATQALERMLGYSNIEYLCVATESDNSCFPLINFIANEKEALVIEHTASRTERRKTDAPGGIVATNHFLDPDWPEEKVDSRSETLLRQERLNKFLENNKGKITPDSIMQYLDKPIKEGGVTQTNAAYPVSTLYQVVYVPETGKMWLKVPNVQDWIEIDLFEK